MKFNAIKLALSATTLLAASGISMQAQAHCLNQSISTANPSAYQQDVYMLNCPSGTASLQGRASLISGTQLAYQIGKGGFTAASVIDTSSSTSATCGILAGGREGITTGTPTGYVSVNGGAGVYTLVASKSTTAGATYGIEFHCMSGANGTGSEVGVIWEQSTNLDVLDTGGVDSNTDINLPINH